MLFIRLSVPELPVIVLLTKRVREYSTSIDARATIAGNRATDDSGRGGVWNQTGALIVRNGAVRNGEALCVESSNTAAGIARYDAPFDVSLVGTV
jgi:hypothetical protein